MIIFFAIVVTLVAVAVIIFGTISHLRKMEKQKYYVAAGNILREDMLNYSLQNTMFGSSNSELPSGIKPMVYIKSKASGKKTSFVFDPQKKIFIGRDRYNSNIFINETYVSNQHCVINIRNGNVFLQDLNSSNGTVLERGILKKYFLTGGEGIFLRTGDKIIVGSIVLKLVIFNYDTSVL